MAGTSTVPPWIQVELVKYTVFTGIATQGSVISTEDSEQEYEDSVEEVKYMYVSLLQIQYGDNIDALVYLMDLNGNIQVCFNNYSWFQIFLD